MLELERYRGRVHRSPMPIGRSRAARWLPRAARPSGGRRGLGRLQLSLPCFLVNGIDPRLLFKSPMRRPLCSGCSRSSPQPRRRCQPSSGQRHFDRHTASWPLDCRLWPYLFRTHWQQRPLSPKPTRRPGRAIRCASPSGSACTMTTLRPGTACAAPCTSADPAAAWCGSTASRSPAGASLADPTRRSAWPRPAWPCWPA